MKYTAFSKTSHKEVAVSPYRARKFQSVVHRDPHRFRIVVAHRRFGKTCLCCAEVLQDAMTLNRANMRMAPPQYAFLAPTEEAARNLGFEQMQRYLGDWPFKARKDPPEITFESSVRPGIDVRIQFLGAHTIDNVRGRRYDGIVIDEFSELPASVWEAAVFPMLADHGGWAMVIGTPKGRNKFYRLYKEALDDPDNWGAHYFPVSLTGYLPKEELDVQLANMKEALYKQEFELEWTAAVPGAYYGSLVNQAELERRITDVPHDPDFPVHTAWDLGISDSTVIWFFQQIGGAIRVIDHWEEQGEHLAKVVTEQILDRKYGDSKVRWGRHYFPHDLAVRDSYTGQTREENVARDLKGHGVVITVPRRNVEDGIAEARRIFPRCYFDKLKCADGLDMLSLYRVQYDMNKNTFTTPLKDETSHSADAFRTLAMGIRPMADRHPDNDTEEAGGGIVDPNMPIEQIERITGYECPYYPGALDVR